MAAVRRSGEAHAGWMEVGEQGGEYMLKGRRQSARCMSPRKRPNRPKPERGWRRNQFGSEGRGRGEAGRHVRAPRSGLLERAEVGGKVAE